MNNITISNNIIEGRENQTDVRARIFTIDIYSGVKTPTNDVIDIALGSEERINIPANYGFEVRVKKDGDSFFESDEVSNDIFGASDTLKTLKTLIKSIPIIREDMTLSDSERDIKASNVWNKVLTIANQ